MSVTRRIALLTGGVLAVVLVVVAVPRIVAGSGASTPRSGSVSQPATSRDTTSGASATGAGGAGAGRSAGFERNEVGARAAAVAYATASQRWLYLSDEELREAVAAIATAEAAPRLADEVVGEIAVARESLAQSSGRVWWLVRPLATRVETVIEERARVAVWTVTVLSATGVAVPQADWMTITVDLAWVDDGWRVAAVDDEAGPTPMVGPRDEPWNARRFDEALDGFERVANGEAR